MKSAPQANSLTDLINCGFGQLLGGFQVKAPVKSMSQWGGVQTFSSSLADHLKHCVIHVGDKAY